MFNTTQLNRILELNHTAWFFYQSSSGMLTVNRYAALKLGIQIPLNEEYFSLSIHNAVSLIKEEYRKTLIDKLEDCSRLRVPHAVMFCETTDEHTMQVTSLEWIIEHEENTSSSRCYGVIRELPGVASSPVRPNYSAVLRPHEFAESAVSPKKTNRSEKTDQKPNLLITEAEPSRLSYKPYMDHIEEIIETITDGFFSFDNEWRFVLMNSKTEKLLNVNRKELLGKSLFEVTPEPKDRVFVDKYLKAAETGVKQIVEHYAVRAGKWIRAVIYPFEDGVAVFIQDIDLFKKTEQRLRESIKEQDVMLGEIHHRVKNNLAIVQGLLELQLYQPGSEGFLPIIRTAQQRIQSMALVHELLYQHQYFSAININEYTHRLIELLKKNYGEESPRIEIDIDICTETEMSIERAVPFGILLNELITNAYKHAFDCDGGLIQVKLHTEQNRHYFVVEDNGKGVDPGILNSTETSFTTLGLTLVNNLVEQLEGNVIFTNAEASGFRVVMDFPKVNSNR
ncbi:MAG: PAS domain-containing protein [Balneolales bacterium]|nr:PAS domain-containing protein [Balneolales bacterium]